MTTHYDAIVAAPTFALGIRCDGDDWISEIEFLEAGSQFQSRYESTLDSFEINLGSSRVSRPVFFRSIGLGIADVAMAEALHRIVAKT